MTMLSAILLITTAIPSYATIGQILNSGVYPANKIEPAEVGELDIVKMYKKEERNTRSKGGGNKCKEEPVRTFPTNTQNEKFLTFLIPSYRVKYLFIDLRQ